MKSKFESLGIYEKAMELGTLSYGLISGWQYFHKNTLGLQMMRSIDSISIAANIAEGYGRCTFRAKRKSVFTVEDQLRKAKPGLIKHLIEV